MEALTHGASEALASDGVPPPAGKLFPRPPSMVSNMGHWNLQARLTRVLVHAPSQRSIMKECAICLPTFTLPPLQDFRCGRPSCVTCAALTGHLFVWSHVTHILNRSMALVSRSVAMSISAYANIDNVNIGVLKGETTKNFVDETLKCLHGIVNTKWHL